MADEVSPEVIQSTQKLLGKHVTKPQLTEKLLKKPPFRFLHDVIVVLVRNGFLKGLYTDAEMNSENVKERDAKIAFLNKIITAVKSISGKDLQAKSSKIIAGLDATETNRLLQTIAKLIDDKVDTKDYVKNLKKPAKDAKKPGDAQESAREASNLKKTTSKTSLNKSTDKLDSTRKKTEKKPVRKGSDDSSPKVKESLTSKTKVDLKKKPVKPDKVEKTTSRTSGATVVSKDSKTSSKVSKTSIPKVSPKEKISPKAASSSSTPKTSNKTSPKQKEEKEDDESPEKHINEVPELEEHQEKPIEPEVSPRDDSWKPQVINEDVDNPDKPPSYQEAKKQDVGASPAANNPLSALKQTNDTENTPAVRQPSARPKSARPRSGSNAQRAPSAQNKNDVNEAARNEIKTEISTQKISSASTAKKPEMKPVMPIRDFSMKSASKERDISSSVMRNKETPIPEVDGVKETEEKQRATPFRPKSSMLRPPSVRPSSARPGAPRLRPESSIPMKEVVPLGKINVIVENYDAKDTTNEEDEEETVVIQSMPDEPAPENNFTEKSLNLDIPADKGHLVEQILEQMQDGGQGEKAQLEWEHEGSKSKDATTKEITALRASIQALTRTANPLGKLASYLHEDVEAMHSELQTWLNMKQQYTVEIAKQKRVNNESNQPLLQQLHNLEESIKHERDEIALIKYNILRNEERIRHLVIKQIAID